VPIQTLVPIQEPIQIPYVFSDDITPDPEMEKICHCCFDDLEENDLFIYCRAGKHMFCYDCVKRYAESGLSEGNGTKKCMNCSYQLAMDYILDENIMDKIKIQEEIKYVTEFAKICEDFQVCPFCKRFGCIVVDDHINPWVECQKCPKKWCKICKGDGHHGPCDKIIDPTPDKIRNHIAETINNAAMHKCPHCSTAYLKDYGCNLMTCPGCKGMSCYICNLKIQSVRGSKYWHFRENGCKLYNDKNNGNSDDQGNQDHTKKSTLDACRSLLEANTPEVQEQIRNMLKNKFKIKL